MLCGGQGWGYPPHDFKLTHGFKFPDFDRNGCSDPSLRLVLAEICQLMGSCGRNRPLSELVRIGIRWGGGTGLADYSQVDTLALRYKSVNPPWRQPRGKFMFSSVNFHINATMIGWHLWEINLRFTPGLTLRQFGARKITGG